MNLRRWESQPNASAENVKRMTRQLNIYYVFDQDGSKTEGKRILGVEEIA